jgi:hypothetical protein
LHEILHVRSGSLAAQRKITLLFLLATLAGVIFIITIVVVAMTSIMIALITPTKKLKTTLSGERKGIKSMVPAR